MPPKKSKSKPAKKTSRKKSEAAKPATADAPKPPPAKPATESEFEKSEELKDALRPELELYFDLRDGSYVSGLNGRFVVMSKADMQMRFKALGLRDDIYIRTKTQGSLRQIDYPFYAAQNERMIDFAGPIAGRRVGIFQDSSGRKYLVTDEAAGVWAPLIPKADPKFFKLFIEELLPGDQMDAFCFWACEAVRAMRAMDFSPGQASFFFGAPKCGKSLLQYMITELLGGRAANPFEYLMGEKFNKDLVGAEHWMFEDPKNSTDNRTRRDFGEGLKEATVNRDIRVRAMCKDATLLQIFRRVTGSVNSEKESIAVVPPMVEGVKDKINLFLCNTVTNALAPFKDANGKPDRSKIWATFLSEVHAVRSWLLQRYSKIPRDLLDERFGVVAYHQPEILSELSSMTYENRFLELVDEQFFCPKDADEILTKIEKRSADWQKELQTFNRYEADKIFRFPGQCGSHLAKLWKQYGSKHTGHDDCTGARVSKRVLDGHTLWTIYPPKISADEQRD